VENMTAEELAAFVAFVSPDVTISQTRGALIEAEVLYKRLSENLGPAHPDLRNAKIARDEYQNALNSMLEAFVRALRADYELAIVRYKTAEAHRIRFAPAPGAFRAEK